MEDDSKPRSIGKQVLILIFSGLLLSVGSCAGFLNTVNINGPIAPIFALGFVAGVLLMIGALIWAVVQASR